MKTSRGKVPNFPFSLFFFLPCGKIVFRSSVQLFYGEVQAIKGKLGNAVSLPTLFVRSSGGGQ